MQAATAFGKRKPVAAGPVAVPMPVLVSVGEAEAPPAPTVAVRQREWPFLTFGLIVALGLIYWAEVNFGFEHGKSLSPDIVSITALGGLDGSLVFESGEWWRIFTAPLLHGSLSHYLGNALALLFAGLILERLVGAPWFGALFVIAGLGGAVGSLALNPSKVVSVGASGAIVGLLAAAFVCSFTFESEQLRRRMRKVSLRFLVPSLLPALMPLGAAAGGTQVDYGAHIGGAIAGALMGLALSETWPEISPRPAFERLAGSIAMGGVAAAALAFVLIAVHFSDYESVYAERTVLLIPQSELPQSEEDGVARSADLVDRFPHDPRAHLLRAIYFLGHRNPADAERQLRLALDERDVLTEQLPPQIEKSLQLVLAVVLVVERRNAEAKTVAQPVCQGNMPIEFLKMRQLLQDQGICG